MPDLDRPRLVIYVNVDDTLIRTAGSKRIPVSGVGDHVLRPSSRSAFCKQPSIKPANQLIAWREVPVG